MLFHVPRTIDPAARSGFHVRVPRMVKGFQDLGYEVDLISGNAAERRLLIAKAKEAIKAGVRYEFLYAENATIPTLLTGKHHLPLHPFLDFGFFRFCRRNGLKIGLFYRDIYWKFPEFSRKVTLIKRVVNRFFHFIDLRAYSRLCDVLYLPSREMEAHLPVRMGGAVRPLPPGIERTTQPPLPRDGKDGLRIFYVGGIGPFYDLALLFRTVAATPAVSLTVCCRKSDWDAWKGDYERYLCERISVVHASGAGLSPYMLQADLGSLFLEPQAWRDFAMPIKLFDYLQYSLPVLGTKGTAAGSFIQENGVGWAIEYSEEALSALIKDISLNPALLDEKSRAARAAGDRHSWRERAASVERDLARQPS